MKFPKFLLTGTVTGILSTISLRHLEIHNLGPNPAQCAGRVNTHKVFEVLVWLNLVKICVFSICLGCEHELGSRERFSIMQSSAILQVLQVDWLPKKSFGTVVDVLVVRRLLVDWIDIGVTGNRETRFRYSRLGNTIRRRPSSRRQLSYCDHRNHDLQNT